MFLIIVVLALSSAALISSVVFPWMDDKRLVWQEKKEEVIQTELDSMFYYDKTPKQIVQLYYILPPVFAILSYVAWKHPVASFIGAIVGFFVPTVILKIRDKRRRAKFNGQILDGIMLLSSSLKGGLSLLQCFEVLSEEMQPPISQEFGLLVRENKMGVTIEESLKRLKKRMNMSDLDLVINSILVARETGGDLTKVFSRLCTTIRDNQKLKENIKTLTLQGRLQGIIMSILPFVFVWWTLQFNKHHFDIMFEHEIGRILLGVAVVLQIVGMFLIRKISIIKV